jgi:hypothetical protein
MTAEQQATKRRPVPTPILIIVILAVLSVTLTVLLVVRASTQPRHLSSNPFEVDYQAAGFQPFDVDDTATYPGVAAFWLTGGESSVYDPATHNGRSWDPFVIQAGIVVCDGMRNDSDATYDMVRQVIRTDGTPLQAINDPGESGPTGGKAIAGLVMLFCPLREPTARQWGVTDDDFQQWNHVS